MHSDGPVFRVFPPFPVGARFPGAFPGAVFLSFCCLFSAAEKRPVYVILYFKFTAVNFWFLYAVFPCPEENPRPAVHPLNCVQILL